MNLESSRKWGPRLTDNFQRARESAVRKWATEATQEAAIIHGRLGAQRAKEWRHKLRDAVEAGKPKVFTSWVADATGPPLSVVEDREGRHLVQPKEVAAAFVTEWGGTLEANSRGARRR